MTLFTTRIQIVILPSDCDTFVNQTRENVFVSVWFLINEHLYLISLSVLITCLQDITMESQEVT